MNYATPQFSAEEINAAGRDLVNLNVYGDHLRNAVAIIDNWRASHAYPAQAFFVTLKRRACKVNHEAITAQRTKRLISIARKLIAEGDMKLTQMQDIAGCRAVLPTIQHVRELEQSYLKGNNKWAHEKLEPKDYIENPRDTGYRGIHLRYRFFGTGEKAVYNKLKIEIQLRTMLQHRWATAVEATDTFTKQALKANGGKKEWQRFFALMGSVFALREECPLVPSTPLTLPELADEIQKLNANFNLASVFKGQSEILQKIEGNKAKAKYYLVELDPVEHMTTIKGFKKDEAQLAHIEYAQLEEKHGKESPIQVVLVSVASIKALKQAYPNYFLDTEEFFKELKKILVLPINSGNKSGS